MFVLARVISTAARGYVSRARNDGQFVESLMRRSSVSRSCQSWCNSRRIIMTTKSKLALVAAAITVLGAAAPALAQEAGLRSQFDSQYSRSQYDTRYGRSENPRAWNGRLNPNSPALNGGGSIGSNELNHDDTE
jgi:hypothetical protein